MADLAHQLVRTIWLKERGLLEITLEEEVLLVEYVDGDSGELARVHFAFLQQGLDHLECCVLGERDLAIVFTLPSELVSVTG